MTLRQRHKKEWVKKFMTKEFTTVEQVGQYLKQKLYGYYDTQLEMEEVNDVSSDMDYLEGLMDATSMALIKCGIEYMDFNKYIEYVDGLKWTKDK